tara:strand:- start:258 stop:671 length:414 start_codon:yes stop_codon:yes gene_type:complete
MIITEIVRGLIIPFPSDDSRTDEGAELIFNGRVRDKEQGKVIIGLEYEHYNGMAEKELNDIAIKTVNKFPIRDLLCRHRVGRVNIGETSLHVTIWSKHRKEGLEAMTYFIKELKKQVPIWKWAILEDGKKIPSACSH